MKSESMANIEPQLKKSSARKTLCKYSHPSILETRREMVRSVSLTCIFIVFSSFYLPFCFAKDSITTMSNDFISDGQTLTSAGKIFQLGFFTCGNRSSGLRRYLGIWYYGSNPEIYVWVANRNTPLKDSNGVFCIAEDGNLALFDESNNPIWKTNVEGWDSFKGIVQLLDSGNLVLKKEDEESRSSRVIWESFQNATDTFLPGMKMDRNLALVSWKDQDNPAQGKFKFQLEDEQYTIRTTDESITWKSKVSGDFLPEDGMLTAVSPLLSNSSGASVNVFRKNKSRPNITTFWNFTATNTRLVMNLQGELQYFTRLKVSAPWKSIWWEPRDPCDMFKTCGVFASCSNSKNRSKCECLPGFEPNSPDSWDTSKDFSEGCRRKESICKGKKNILDFKPLTVIKVGKPDRNFEASTENECKEDCLRTCTCQAYSYETSQLRADSGGKTCWIWSDDLNNIQFNDTDTDEGRKINLRVQNNTDAEPTENTPDGHPDGTNKQFNQWPLVVAVIFGASVTAVAVVMVYIYKQKAKLRKQGSEERGSNLPLHFYDGQRYVQELIDSGRFNDEDKKGIDLPFFDLESILAATDNFSEANKLGKGGFGPVYKGHFPGGQEIAVKRLSRVSGQGMEEFKNEVVLIARLQHRNLVRLLGYCIEGDEKILLYEFMPNKSLDSFIFDSNLSELLDWEIRFNIILGIARGLLYLHQDSRLRIIHRDLKTSNILLDKEMNPKISDFGLARIFQGKQTEGATNRVVGTYGYMSPEYALDGFFSIKSDVFSFGVVVLEIISGKRNTGFYNSQEALSLIGYAWKLWQEGKALDMMDQKLSACSKTRFHEILKCINVGLLCVQEDSVDRPTMSDVVILLGSVTATLLTPKRPAFVLRRVFNSMASSSSSKTETNNEMTVTLEGR